MFVTGGDGFLGSELIRILAEHGHRVFGLAASVEAADVVRRAGAIAVAGDPLAPGGWQDEAAADWVFHVPPSDRCRWPAIRGRAGSSARRRLLMDAHLLDAVANGTTRRMVYVHDASGYETPAARPITEDEPMNAGLWARTFAPALDRLEGYVLAGLPIVRAFAGRIYGNGSWFRDRVVDPVMAGRRVVRFGKGGPWVSPIHVHDCARALVHLIEHGATGGRYFVANSEPVRMHALAETFAALANRPLRVWPLPAWTARVVGRSVCPGFPQGDAVFANIRLRATGFQFRYPTLAEGMRQIVTTLE